MENLKYDNCTCDNLSLTVADFIANGVTDVAESFNLSLEEKARFEQNWSNIIVKEIARGVANNRVWSEEGNFIFCYSYLISNNGLSDSIKEALKISKWL